MTIKDELKKQYRDKKLAEVETIATKLLDDSISNRRDFILALYYLDFTNRYKENPTYKNSPFEAYINDRFHLRLKTYHKERWAFLKHEKAAIAHGPGLITKIKETCGPMKVKEIIDKIEYFEKATKRPLSISKIKEVIAKNALPVKEKPLAEAKSVIEARLVKAQQIIQEINKNIDEKDEQITKLKATVMRLKAENQDLKKAVESYRAREKQIVPLWHELSNMIGQSSAIV